MKKLKLGMEICLVWREKPWKAERTWLLGGSVWLASTVATRGRGISEKVSER